MLCTEDDSGMKTVYSLFWMKNSILQETEPRNSWKEKKRKLLKEN